MFLVILKNPQVQFLVDSYNEVLRDDQIAEFEQEGLRLIIPVSNEWNIAYIKEVTDEEVLLIEEESLRRVEEYRKKVAKLESVKPGFKIPKKLH